MASIVYWVYTGVPGIGGWEGSVWVNELATCDNIVQCGWSGEVYHLTDCGDRGCGWTSLLGAHNETSSSVCF